MKKITVIGCGYVGLVTGACLAEMGNQVICLDVDFSKIQTLQKGVVPFYEPGLEQLVQEMIAQGRLHFTTSYHEGIKEAELCFLALPTPSQTDGSCDVSFVLQAVKELARHLDHYLIIINKSTIPVGTTQQIAHTIQSVLDTKEGDIFFDVVSNPEFLQEGLALHNFRHPDRIILGVENTRAEKILRELYAPFHHLIQVMDIPSAELSKYAANAMLALRISFMNHFAGLCEKVGANIKEVQRGMGADPRIGPRYLQAGIGFGGSCLPKDVAALCSISQQSDHPSDLFHLILEINARQKRNFFSKIENHFENLEGKTLAILGLSFKPHTDDIREAPSLDFIEMSIDRRAHLRLFDPVSMPKVKQLFPGDLLTFCEDPYDAATKADAIVLLTEWPEFRSLDLQKMGALMKTKTFFDGRNQFNELEMHELGFDYFAVGKQHHEQKAWIQN